MMPTPNLTYKARWFIIRAFCFIVFVTIIGTTATVHAQSAVSLPERIEEIQDERDYYDLDLYTNIHTRVILELLARECSVSSLQKAQDFLTQADQIITRDYARLSDSRMLEKSLVLYETVERLSQDRVDTDYIWSRYCTLKYAMTGLMKLVRDKHIQKLKNTWLYNDFENVRAELGITDEIFGS